MKIHLKYGKKGLTVDFPDRNVTVIEPGFVAGLPDEKTAFFEALRNPVGMVPLRECIKANDTIVIVFCDITRPVPNDRIIPWLLEELSFHPKEKITLINAIGLHRSNTEDELVEMLTEEVMKNYRVINHTATDLNALTYLGTSSFGGEVYVNSEYYEADVTILTGCIEPHPFAGFSGGPKLVLPGLAGMQTIVHNHGAAMIGNPLSTWGITQGNPIWEEMHEAAKMTNPTCIVNVTVNKDQAITGIFAGDMDEAHAKGVEWIKSTVMQPVHAPFDIVITTNSGYPLDLNLVQALKGVSAARQIVKQGGSIIAVSECSQGIPDSHYKKILHETKSRQETLDRVKRTNNPQREQWIAQIQAMIQMWADIYMYSSLLADEVKKAHIEPIASVEICLAELIKKYGPQTTIAVLPEGPQTIPYLHEQQ